MMSEYQSFDIDGIYGDTYQADVGILTPEEMDQIRASLSLSSPLGRITSKSTIEENEQEA